MDHYHRLTCGLPPQPAARSLGERANAATAVAAALQLAEALFRDQARRPSVEHLGLIEMNAKDYDRVLFLLEWGSSLVRGIHEDDVSSRQMPPSGCERTARRA